MVDASGRAIIFLTPDRRSAAKLLTKDEARQGSMDHTLIDPCDVAVAVRKCFPAPDSSSGNPFAPKMSLGEKRRLTPEEQEKQKQLDADYKKATKKIPDQKAADPWGGVRPTPTAKSQFKNESLAPYHSDSFNKQTPE